MTKSNRETLLKKTLITAILSHLLILPGYTQTDNTASQIAVLEVGGTRLTVEIADTPAATAAGLMHRQNMPTGTGMLFDFIFPRKACMWMKNTLVPLDVAFIGSNCVIIALAAMTPHDLTPVCSPTKVRYVLEVPAGTFKALGAEEGTTVTGGPFGNL